MIFAPDPSVPTVRTGSQAIFAYATALIALTDMIQAHQLLAYVTAQRMVRADMPTAS